MHKNNLKDISRFFLAGINFRKTDAELRGKFAVGPEQYEKILGNAVSFQVEELFILSTCNRTEIYGFADEPSDLIKLLCTETSGDAETFNDIAYVKQGYEAIQYLFEVTAGLDSQILGDYEIVGQFKKAIRFAKDHGYVGWFLERLANCVLQCSKSIKNNTQLSGGTISVSFSAVQYIRQQVKDFASKKILLIGTGKIGRNTCKNLVDYLNTRNVTVINRTNDKAVELAVELGLEVAPLEEMEEQVRQADIILVATNSEKPIIERSHLENTNEKTIIDLSIPCNVEASVKTLPQITLLNVDELSRMKDETLKKREAEIPKAKMIITEILAEFSEWYEMRKHVPILKAIKTKLKEIHQDTVYTYDQGPVDEKIQRVITITASKMRSNNQAGCYYIQAINEFIATGTD